MNNKTIQQNAAAYRAVREALTIEPQTITALSCRTGFSEAAVRFACAVLHRQGKVVAGIFKDGGREFATFALR